MATTKVETNKELDEQKAFYANLDGVRPYACYFSVSSNKKENELDVILLLNNEWQIDGKETFDPYSLQYGEDPPDFVASMKKSGKMVAIEVTELVDEKEVQKRVEETRPTSKKRGFGENIKNNNLDNNLLSLCCATPSYVIEKMETIIRKKDAKDYKGGPYDLCILIIYCDDHKYLDIDNLNAIRDYQKWPDTNKIHHVYFFPSPCSFDSHPYIQLL